MDTGLSHEGLITLDPGVALRLRNAAGRHMSVVRGTAWVTQDGDRRDHLLKGGGSLRFDRNELVLVMALDGQTKIVLEEGLAPESGRQPVRLSLPAQDIAYFGRRARRMRAEAMVQMLASFGAGLKAAWRRIARSTTAALQARRTARDLGALNDHILRDVGLRRDQIVCAARQILC